MFSTQTIAALAVEGLLGFAIPIAAVVIFKLKHRDAKLRSVFIGAGTFFVFAIVLESLLHRVMLPIVQDNTWAYAIYGALAAGVFEETGRLVAYKTLMKRNYSTENAVFMGIGHGGFEAMIIMGFSMLMYLVIAVTVNGYGGMEAFMEATKDNVPAAMHDQMGALVEILEQVNFATVLLALYERLIAMTFHVCMSVWVYKAVTHKMWLYPAAILTHALLDFFAALYSKGIITSALLLYIILTVFAAVIVFATVKLAKKFPDKQNS